MCICKIYILPIYYDHDQSDKLGELEHQNHYSLEEKLRVIDFKKTDY